MATQSESIYISKYVKFVFGCVLFFQFLYSMTHELSASIVWIRSLTTEFKSCFIQIISTRMVIKWIKLSVASLSCFGSNIAMLHYSDVIMSTIRYQIIGVSKVCSTIGSGADQRKHQNSASLAFVRGIHRWPVDSPHKWPVMQKMSPFDDVII